MSNPSDPIDNAQKTRWSGEIRYRFLFGQVKDIIIVAKADPKKPINLDNFRQPTRSDEIVGQ